MLQRESYGYLPRILAHTVDIRGDQDDTNAQFLRIMLRASVDQPVPSLLVVMNNS